jgi:alpha-amylase
LGKGLLAASLLVAGCADPLENELADVRQAEEAVAGRQLGTTPSGERYHGAGTDVLLQGFHWNSHQSGTWNTIKNNATAIKNAGFTMVWFPPVSKSTGGAGYLPNEWYNLNSAHGTDAQLRAAVSALTAQGVKSIADIVVNHRVGTTNWADFSNPAFASNASAVTREDEWGQGTGNYDTGDGYSAARDLDHTNGSVQTEIKNWLAWLKNNVGFSGWRYDYVKGFSGSYVGMYNDHTNPHFSVGELWPDITGNYYASGSGVNYHRQKLMDWINATGDKSTAFDFTTKWQLMLATQNSEYWRLRDPDGKPIGAIGWWPQRSVTFVDNHDTGPSPGVGQDHWPFPSNKVEEGYAYILTHPGIPSVYWPHYFDWGTDMQNKIKALIGIRKSQGINSGSSVAIQVADAGKYAAIVNGNTAVKIGGGSWSPGSGWTLSASGSGWAVWKKDTATGGGTGTDYSGTYKIVAKHSGKVLSADGTANGSNVSQYAYSNTGTRKWVIANLGNGYYKITSVASGRSLDVSGVSTADGANIHLWDYVGGNNQQWKIEDAGGGYVKITARHSGKSLDVAGVSTADGANIHQWGYVGGDNQKWQLAAP